MLLSRGKAGWLSRGARGLLFLLLLPRQHLVIPIDERFVLRRDRLVAAGNVIAEDQLLHAVAHGGGELRDVGAIRLRRLQDAGFVADPVPAAAAEFAPAGLLHV